MVTACPVPSWTIPPSSRPPETLRRTACLCRTEQLPSLTSIRSGEEQDVRPGPDARGAVNEEFLAFHRNTTFRAVKWNDFLELNSG